MVVFFSCFVVFCVFLYLCVFCLFVFSLFFFVFCVFFLVVVEWLYYSKRIIIVRWADLSDFFSFIFAGKMCVFVSRPMTIATFLRKNEYPPKRVVDFHRERDTYSETKSWKSSRIFDEKVTTTTVNPGNRRGFCV